MAGAQSGVGQSRANRTRVAAVLCSASAERMAPELIEWREFFVTTATDAGALVGLLFVSISVHLRLLSDERSEDLREDARNILFQLRHGDDACPVPAHPANGYDARALRRHKYHALGNEQAKPRYLRGSACWLSLMVNRVRVPERSGRRGRRKRSTWAALRVKTPVARV